MVNYDDILDILTEEDGHCILFVGPQLLESADGKTLETALHKALDAKNPQHDLIRAFYEDDGFFLLKEENLRRKFVRQVRRFYSEEHPTTDATLQKLARLPFPLVISLNPDELLHRAFGAQHLDYNQGFYHKKHPFEPYVSPSPERPLLYGMLGSLTKPDSIVFTHKDLFSYLESIFAGKSMSPNLRKYIQDANAFIFVGLPFEKWYMQLLLRVLYHISSKLEKLEQYASHPTNKDLHGIFKEEFKIEFAPENGVSFINNLYAKAEKRGILREIPTENARQSTRQSLKKAKEEIRKNHIKEGIELLNTVLENNLPLTQDLLEDLTLQEQRFKALDQKDKRGTALESDKTRLTQAIFRIITLISDTQKLLQL